MAYFFNIMAENYLLFPILFVLPLLYLIFKKLKCYSSSAKSKSLLPLPPGPAAWPLLGNIAELNKLSPIGLAKLSQKHGQLFLLQLGTQYMVVASSPASATEILKTHDRNLSARAVPEALPPELFKLDKSSVSWAETCDTAWNSLRTVWRTKLFSSKSLEAQLSLRDKKITEMVEHVRSKQGQIVDVGEIVLTTVFNIFGNVVFSRDLIDLNEEKDDGGIKDVMRSLMETIILPNVSDFYPSLSKFDLQGRKKSMWKYINKFRAIWGPIIESRRKTGDFSSQKDFLDVLLHENFTDARIHQMVLELFTAGIDTTSATIEWGIAELVKAPESMKKVIAELDQEFNKDSITENRLMQLPYLQASIKETLRLHPAVPLLLHRANEECEVMNYKIPQNAKVFVNLWAVLRDPLTWDEPSRFKPERFMNSVGDFKGIDGYIPFGGGRRVCPGSPLAIRSVPLFIGALLHTFEWSLPLGNDPSELDMKESFGLTMKKEQPLLLIPAPRN